MALFGQSIFCDPNFTGISEARARPGKITFWEFSNGPGSVDAYIQIFDSKSEDVTLGETVPDICLYVPKGGGNAQLVNGDSRIKFETAITVAVTTQPDNGEAPAQAIVANIISHDI